MEKIVAILDKGWAFVAAKYTPVLDLWHYLGGIVWAVAKAAVFLAISVWILGLLKSLVEWLLGILAIDKLADLLGINKLIKKVSSASFCDLLVSIVYWIAMLGIFISTVKILGVKANIAKSIDYLISLMPNVVSALFIIIVAILVAGFVSGLIRFLAGYFKDVNGEVLGKATSFIVILYAVIISIGQLEVIDTQLINTALIVSFIGFVLAAALGSTKEAAAAVKGLVVKAKSLVTPKKKK